MAKIILLDAGILGMVTHPRPNPDIMGWMTSLRLENSEIWIPEIADYELRRKLLHLDFIESVHRLDELKTNTNYVSITTDIMLKAAELWAEARKQGKPTADVKALDADMILSAQAILLKEAYDDEVIIATDNIGHLSLFADARHWQDI